MDIDIDKQFYCLFLFYYLCDRIIIGVIMKKGIICIGSILIIIVGGLIYYLDNKKYNFKIYVFNAGKADAIIISKNNKYVMIDTGEDTLSDEILEYFKKNNIKKLEYLIITHFDKDHVGSASSIIDNIEIGEVLQSNYIKESEYYSNYVESLEKKNIEPITVEGEYGFFIDGVKFIVNGPNEIYDNEESNNSSLIVSITNKDNSFLFMGDSENARIKDFLSSNNETFDFIKVPYHGNYLKRLEDLLKQIKPKYGVITCSKKEGCDNKTLKLLDEYDVDSYLTRAGSVSISSDGKKIKVLQ